MIASGVTLRHSGTRWSSSPSRESCQRLVRDIGGRGHHYSDQGEWIADLRAAHAEIGLPRFTANYAGSLDAALTSLGMGAAFDPNIAEFPGIASRAHVYISDIEHELPGGLESAHSGLLSQAKFPKAR